MAGFALLPACPANGFVVAWCVSGSSSLGSFRGFGSARRAGGFDPSRGNRSEFVPAKPHGLEHLGLKNPSKTFGQRSSKVRSDRPGQHLGPALRSSFTNFPWASAEPLDSGQTLSQSFEPKMEGSTRRARSIFRLPLLRSLPRNTVFSSEFAFPLSGAHVKGSRRSSLGYWSPDAFVEDSVPLVLAVVSHPRRACRPRDRSISGRSVKRQQFAPWSTRAPLADTP